jgi:hypothetical protein
MGVSVHGTYRVEGRRDEARTHKTNWPPQCVQTQRKTRRPVNRRVLQQSQPSGELIA